MRKALIIEDNADIAKLVQMHLRDLQCEADIVIDGETGLQKFQQSQYDLVILDLMLPGMDGLSVCQKIRAGSDYVPILMLTAKATELDRVLGLEIGADDYLTKPFSIPELLARIKALFRRVEALKQKNTTLIKKNDLLIHGDVSMDLEKRQVKISGKEILLTAKEFDLLAHFASHPGRVYSRLQLLEQVWDYHHEGYEHTVNSHINRLRAKIEKDPAKPDYILTVWGVGYRFTEAGS